MQRSVRSTSSLKEETTFLGPNFIRNKNASSIILFCEIEVWSGLAAKEIEFFY